MSSLQRASLRDVEGSEEGTRGRATNGLPTADLLMLVLSSESNINVRARAWSW